MDGEVEAGAESSQNTLPVKTAAPLQIKLDELPAQVEPLYAAAKITDVLMPAAYERIGQIVLTEEELNSLAAPTPDDEIDIRPDGLIYVSHEYIRRRLLEAFGPMGWSLVPGSPLARRPDSQEYYQRWILFIHGIYAAEALSGRVYYAKNSNQQQDDDGGGGNFMTVDDLAEAIKSDCLRRCCKDIGLGLQAWSKGFQREWKREFAVQVIVKTNKGNKRQWRRKDDDPFTNRYSGENIEVTSGVEDNKKKQQASSTADSGGKDAAQNAQPSRQSQADGGQSAEREPAKELRDKPSSTASSGLSSDGRETKESSGNADAGANRPAPKQEEKPKAAPAASTQTQPQRSTSKLLVPQVNMLMQRLMKAQLIVEGDVTAAVDWVAEWLGDAAAPPPSESSLKALIDRIPASRFTTIVKKIDERIKEVVE